MRPVSSSPPGNAAGPDTDSGSAYDREYYGCRIGDVPYERNDHWLNFFGLVAEHVIRSLHPRTVFDAGCAMGMLVEAFWDRGVEAWGIDLSRYAIGQVRPDMRRYCRTGSLTKPLQGRYDLVTCIEVLEHMSPEDSQTAIRNITGITDTILFSSSPSDFSEPTHINVQPPLAWLKQFAAHGFGPDCVLDASFLAPHAMLLRRQSRPFPDDVLVLYSEKLRYKCALVEREQRIGALNAQLAAYSGRQSKTAPVSTNAVHKLPAPEQLAGIDIADSDLYAEYVRVQHELHDIYASPAWRLVTKYRTWLQRSRWSPWLSKYEKAARWTLRRMRLAGEQQTLTAGDSTHENAGTMHADRPAYDLWIRENEPGPAVLDLQRSISYEMRLQPLISVLAPVYKVPLTVLKDMVESVRRQTYHNWELCIAHGDPEDAEGRAYLTELAAADNRVKIALLDANRGISGNSNAALESVSGEFTALLDHDDTLAPFALLQVAEAINDRPDADFLYSDKDCLTEDGARRTSPLFKPVWSPAAMLCANYVTHFTVMRTAHLRSIGGWRTEVDGAQDWDLFLRLTERAREIVFIPGVLYHWRRISTSVASGGLKVKPYAAEAQLRAINDHLDRTGIAAKALFNGCDLPRIVWDGNKQIAVSIILVSKPGGDIARRARQVADETQWGQFEVIANASGPNHANIKWLDDSSGVLAKQLTRAAERAGSDVLVFIDDHVDIPGADWLNEVTGPFQQQNTGICGVLLIDPGTLRTRHAGIVFNNDGLPDYIFSGEPPDTFGEFGGCNWYRNWSAVSGACFAIRRELFLKLGGFQENPSYPRHDIDLCLRANGIGDCRIFFNPHARFDQKGEAALEEWLGPREAGAGLVKACYPGGDPHFHGALQSRKGKMSFRLGRSMDDKLDYSAEARALVPLFDATPAEIAKSRAAADGKHEIRSLTWFIPDFTHGFYGGIHTILRFADHFLREHGVHSEFAVRGLTPEPLMKARIAKAFPDLARSATVVRLDHDQDYSRIAASDASIATLWSTAYPALHSHTSARKFYFLQDWESLFYPAGSLSALVEATYRFGFTGICNTRSLRDAYAAYGGQAEYFDPCIDPAVFYPPKTPRETTAPFVLFCYMRPSHPRNGFELLSAALKLAKSRLKHEIRIVAAGAEWDPARYQLEGVVENLGLLSYPMTGALYRACDAGLVMMMTRHPSYLPMELMACGALVISNENRDTGWLLKHEHNCLLTTTTPSAIADAIERGVRDPDLRRGIVERAGVLVRNEYTAWGAQADKIYRFMTASH